MPSRLNPYLRFRDNAQQAMDFYKTVFGGELDVSTFGSMPMGADPSENDKVMHSQLETPNGFTLMASDTPNMMEYKPNGNGVISLSGDNEAELRGYWDKLAQGGQVDVPLEPAPWGDSFGQLTDKFGTTWMVNIAGQRG